MAKKKAKKAAGQTARTRKKLQERAGRAKAKASMRSGGSRKSARRAGNRGAVRRAGNRKAGRRKAAAARRKSPEARPKAAKARAMRAPGKLTLAPALPRAEKTAKFSRGTRRLDESGNVVLPDALGSGADSGGQSGDLQGLSEVERADSESVVELLEDGQAFEAEAVSGVENAPDADAGEVKTHEVREDDVPTEYDDQ